jgi:mono/diheme cytochrome c family protein
MSRIGAVLGSMVMAAWLAAPVARAQEQAAPPQRANLELIRKGQNVWQKKRCAACHGIGQPHSGPDLSGVTQRRSRDWLHRWMKDSQGMLKKGDSVGVALMREYNNLPMPSFKLSEKDTDALLAFIVAEEGRLLRAEERARQRARP